MPDNGNHKAEQTREALLRAATYLKWFRDRAITVDTESPDDIGDIVVILEQLAEQVEDTQRWNANDSA